MADWDRRRQGRVLQAEQARIKGRGLLHPVRGQVQLGREGRVRSSKLESFCGGLAEGGLVAFPDGLVALADGSALLDEGDPGQRNSDGEADGKCGHRSLAQFGGAALVADGGREEGSTHGTEVVARRRGPPAGPVQAASPVQSADVQVIAIPRRRGLFDVLPDEVARPVLIDPVAQARPCADECLMGDLDSVPGLREQSAARVRVEDRSDIYWIAAVAQQVFAAHGPAGVIASVADLDKAEEDRAGAVPACGIQTVEGPLGSDRDRVLDAARRGISVHCQGTAVTLLPCGLQRVRQQREAPCVITPGGAVDAVVARRVSPQIAEQQFDQAAFHVQARRLRREQDRFPQLGLRHGPDKHLPGR